MSSIKVTLILLVQSAISWTPSSADYNSSSKNIQNSSFTPNTMNLSSWAASNTFPSTFLSNSPYNDLGNISVLSVPLSNTTSIPSTVPAGFTSKISNSTDNSTSFVPNEILFNASSDLTIRGDPIGMTSSSLTLSTLLNVSNLTFNSLSSRGTLILNSSATTTTAASSRISIPELPTVPDTSFWASFSTDAASLGRVPSRKSVQSVKNTTDRNFSNVRNTSSFVNSTQKNSVQTLKSPSSLKNTIESTSTIKLPKIAKTWMNGDVLCDPMLHHCGVNGTCVQSVNSGRYVCHCHETYLPMTYKLECPGKSIDDNYAWNPVECTNNYSICGSRSRCLRTYWFKDEEDSDRSFCFCKRTMEPMREDFTCPPLSRFNVKKVNPPIICVEDDVQVCGEEAECRPNITNPSIKVCTCLDTNEPPGGPQKLCRRPNSQPFDPFAFELEYKREQQMNQAATSQEPVNVTEFMTLSITTELSTVSPTTRFWSFLLDNVLWLVSVMIILIFVSLGGFLYRRKCSKANQNISENKSVIPLESIFLQADRYTTNAHYYMNTDGVAESAPLISVCMIDRSRITDLREIGEGHFGKVYKGQLHTVTNGIESVEMVAVKIMKRTTNHEDEDNFLREVDIMSTFRHENILSVAGYCARDEHNGPWMIFEYMPFGDLVTVLRNSNHYGLNFPGSLRLSPRALLTTALQIANGMEYLAKQRFVHRDLACRNCLVGSGMVVKIADFGMSRDVYTCDYYRIGGMRLLPVRWMSPESLGYGKFTLESDIWSYGVVLWEIFSYGRQPYYGHTNEQVLNLIVEGRFLDVPEQCPSSVAEIMKGCWRIEAKERMSFTEIRHRFARIIDDADEKRSEIRFSPAPDNLPAVRDSQIELSEDDTVLEDDCFVDEVEDDIELRVLDKDGYVKLSSTVTPQQQVPEVYVEHAIDESTVVVVEPHELEEDGYLKPTPAIYENQMTGRIRSSAD